MLRSATALGGVAASLLLVASADAAVFISPSASGPDAGPAAVETQVITFDSGLEPGVTLAGGQIVSGSASMNYLAPADDVSPYLAVGANGAESAVLSFASFLGERDVSQFSFFWGSIDTYNTLQLLSRSGAVLYSMTGAALPAAPAGQALALTNRRVTFTLTGSDMELGGLRFTSSRPAFEVDTLSFATLAAAVPEPASWALMIAGFGAAGVTLRRRKAAIA
jgi:hypothetical protein